MPPFLALTLYIIFILLLLRLDRKQAPKVSFAMWIPTIWMLLITSKAVCIWTGIGGHSMEEGSPLDRVVLVALFLIGVFILAKRNFNWADGFKGNMPFILLITFMLLSTLWSDMPFITFRRWVREACIVIVMAFVISTEAHPRQALESLFRRIIYVHIPLSYLLIDYYPHLGRQYHRWTGDLMWIGVATQKNGLAVLCTFALFFFIWTLIRRRRGVYIPVTGYQKYIEMFLIILTIWLLMGPKHTLTYSSTSFASLIVGLTALLWLLWLKRRNITLGKHSLEIFIALIIFYGTITPFLGGLKIFDPSALLNRDATLTGRTEIWAALVPHAMQHFYLGYGLSSFWTDELRGTIDANAHNGYLDIILGIGLIGLIFWSIFLISSCCKARREMERDYHWGIFWFCIILIAVVRSIAESSISSLQSIMQAVIIFFNVCLQPKNTNHF